MVKMLSEHFSLDEFTCSQTAARQGIDNTPGPAELVNLRTLAGVLEQVRQALGNRPLIISSGYRSPALNKAVGGSPNSAHIRGLAADFTVPTLGTVLQTCKAVAGCCEEFDQVIFEYGRWVHLGLAAPGVAPRHELLSIGSQGRYVPGLTTQC